MEEPKERTGLESTGFSEVTFGPNGVGFGIVSFAPKCSAELFAAAAMMLEASDEAEGTIGLNEAKDDFFAGVASVLASLLLASSVDDSDGFFPKEPNLVRLEGGELLNANPDFFGAGSLSSVSDLLFSPSLAIVEADTFAMEGIGVVALPNANLLGLSF